MRDIDAGIAYLETVTQDRFVHGGTNTEVSSIILARMAKDVRIIKNIAIVWVVLACLGILGIISFAPLQFGRR